MEENKSKDYSWDQKKGLVMINKPPTTATNKPKDIKEYIKDIVREMLDEESASGDAGPYATPFAFKKTKSMNESLENIIKEELLNEVTYNKFKNEVKFRTKNEALHKAIREVKRKLLEVDRLIDYTTRMKQELSESEDGVNYWKRSLKAVDEINETSNRISNKIKSIYQ